jgi:hypothetical protein
LNPQKLFLKRKGSDLLDAALRGEARTGNLFRASFLEYSQTAIEGALFPASAYARNSSVLRGCASVKRGNRFRGERGWN